MRALKVPPLVLVLNLHDKKPKVYHRVEEVEWDDGWGCLRTVSRCHFADWRSMTSYSRALIHVEHAEMFADPCSNCYPLRRGTAD